LPVQNRVFNNRVVCCLLVIKAQGVPIIILPSHNSELRNYLNKREGLIKVYRVGNVTAVKAVAKKLISRATREKLNKECVKAGEMNHEQCVSQL